MPAITVPRPSVAPSRKTLRGKRSPGSGAGIPASPVAAGGAGAPSVADSGPPAAGTGATAGWRRELPVALRTPREPKTNVGATATATAGPLTITPARRATDPGGEAERPQAR